MSTGKRVTLAIAALAILAGLYWGLAESGWLDRMSDEDRLRRTVAGLGLWGPAALAALLAAAIVLSPIPSAPIAMVAGAMYGAAWGTVVTVVGAEAGALIAFLLSRHLGYGIVRQWGRIRPMMDWLERDRSQTMLMAVVFLSRLLPFVSFDAISYAAGLTPLAFWRFAVATLLGVVPVSFALAYFGEELMDADSAGLRILAVLVGGITLLPLALRLLWPRRKQLPDRDPI